VYRFVIGRGATIDSGFDFVSLVWILTMAGVLVYGVEAFVLFYFGAVVVVGRSCVGI